MKQRIRVVGIVRSEDGILILKRSHNRSDMPILWELPTGKIKFGEQPEEAMARALIEQIGANATSVRLRDVITFLAPEGASRVGNLYIVYEVNIDENTKIELSEKHAAYKFTREISSGIRLNEASASVFEIVSEKVPLGHLSPRETAFSIKIYVDGASRGNPGPSGIGYCLVDNNGSQIEKGGEFIGFATSRVAEYYAMKRGLELAIDRGYKTAHFYSDSLMVVNQINGIFSIKNRDILPIYEDIKTLIDEFEAVSFTHISRTLNVVADKEANVAIDHILAKNSPLKRK